MTINSYNAFFIYAMLDNIFNSLLSNMFFLRIDYAFARLTLVLVNAASFPPSVKASTRNSFIVPG